MSDIAFLFGYLLALILSAAALLKVGDFLSRPVKFSGSGWAFAALACVGLVLSLYRWSDYSNGRASLLQAIGTSLLLAGLPFLVVLSLALHELPFRLIAMLWNFVSGKRRTGPSDD
jgi:hypothetical protein